MTFRKKNKYVGNVFAKPDFPRHCNFKTKLKSLFENAFFIKFCFLSRFLREESSLAAAQDLKPETDFLDFIRYGDVEAIENVLKDPAKVIDVSHNLSFVKKCAKEVVGTGNLRLLK